jgi:SAM-dependent methyltransferase
VTVREHEHTVWHDVECGAYGADLPLWRRLAREAADESGCDLLELGCGTGRVSLGLAGRGRNVSAIDVDPELVAVLRRRAGDRGATVDAVVADVRSFELGRRFDLVLAPMQLVQLLSGARQRLAMLRRVAAHLRPGAQVALAMLAMEEEWSLPREQAPLPDMREVDGWVYASRPIAVRRVRSGAAIELDRIRQMVSPEGEVEETLSRIRLEIITPERLEQEGLRAGLVPQPRRYVPPTADHVGSCVVVLRADG